MRNECNIIRDILPLYVENMVSDDTASFVREHLEKCDLCRSEAASLRQASVTEKDRREFEAAKKSFLAMQRKWKTRSAIRIACGILAAVLLAALALSTYAYFRVDGTEIAGVAEISDSCTVTLITYQHMEYGDRKEYVLSSLEIEILKNLLLNSTFTRSLEKVRYIKDYDHYEIRIDFNDGQNYLSFRGTGNESITVTNQFDGNFLLINNPQWEDTLILLAQSASQRTE